ncbi:stage II sporulation protein E [Thalassobacillus sp. CUG 92003]|uniref:stage II sporulation protein E n=1 Tax=Thalassobacillus sp. CUG 92003 TaxID=2736641 RepID=UPI0015E6D1A1|nr:stage II sporulation protein E [Thalassobacillus sp. CUG 92003]
MQGTVRNRAERRLTWGFNSAHAMSRKLLNKLSYVLIDKGVLLMIIALLLGRAVILSSMAPFGVALIASVWWMRRSMVVPVLLFMIGGAVTVGVGQAAFVAGSALTFMGTAMILHKAKQPQKLLPWMALLACVVPRMITLALLDRWELYDLVLVGAEGVLSAILVLIFMQSLPLISPKKYRPALKNEEIVCMIILLASILTGTIGWQVQGIAIEQVLSRYLVLFLAYIGGAAIGATVGVVTGLVLTLASVAQFYQMSLLAFAGLLGGLLKEGKKLGVSAGLLVGTLLITIYGVETSGLATSMWESGAAVCLFLVTPERWIRTLSRYVPGTQEHTHEQEQYLQKVRDVTAVRVGKFSDVFQALSRSFSHLDKQADHQEEKEFDYFLSHVTEKTCQTCFKKDKCWARQFDETYGLMSDLMMELDQQNEPSRVMRKDVEQYCVKPQKLIDTMKHELSFYQANQQLKKQVLESRRFVSDQLRGVSEVMENFANEIVKEREHHEHQEHYIHDALEKMGFDIEKLDIYTLEPGSVDIEMDVLIDDYRGEGAKLIAPVLSDILEETVIVSQEDISPFPSGRCHLEFRSAQQFKITSGVAHAAKGGGFVSGDSYSVMELGTGKFALAISDGMGNGERAHEESVETLRLLKQILQSGIKEEVAIQSINSILALRTSDEIFSTLDLAIIDLHQASSKFIKIGSTPSFIKRGSKILTVESGNLPMGIIQDVDVDMISEQLKSGDLLIMMSDGMMEGPKHVENVELWLKRKIREINSEDPQTIADVLLEEVIRSQSGGIVDDITVLVARIDHHIPEWAAIQVGQKQAR